MKRGGVNFSNSIFRPSAFGGEPTPPAVHFEGKVHTARDNENFRQPAFGPAKTTPPYYFFEGVGINIGLNTSLPDV